MHRADHQERVRQINSFFVIDDDHVFTIFVLYLFVKGETQVRVKGRKLMNSIKVLVGASLLFTGVAEASTKSAGQAPEKQQEILLQIADASDGGFFLTFWIW